MGDEEKQGIFGSLKDKFKDYIYGMAAHEMTRQAVRPCPADC